MKTPFTQSLIAIGLTESESLVYETLLASGKAGVAYLARKCPGVTRSNIYALLQTLRTKGLVRELPGGIRKEFMAESPTHLTELTTAQETRAKEARSSLDLALPQLLSQFNLVSGRPNVQFYEGESGVKKVIFDSLSTTGEILQYLDNDAVDTYYKDINKEYMAERKRRGIQKKIIVWDTPSARKTALEEIDPSCTEMRCIRTRPSPVTMMIYGNKLSYQTIGEEAHIGVILEDAHIVAMHRELFFFTWEGAERLVPQSVTSGSSTK